MEKIIIKNEYIEYLSYDLPFTSVYPKGKLYFNQISEYIENFIPPAIRTNKNELIFVNEKIKKELKSIFIKNNIEIVKREDLWSYILECFLDTEFTKRTEIYCYEKLKENGINKEKCDGIRKCINNMMISYNFDSCLWDWTYLGLFDLLSAANGILSGAKYKMSKDKYKSFYQEAKKIALQGKINVQKKEKEN